MKRPLIKGGQGRDGETLWRELQTTGIVVAVCGSIILIYSLVA